MAERMKVGIIDVDAVSNGKSSFPNLALMKLSAWHKRHGDEVQMYEPLLSGHCDRVYLSKVFTFTDDYPWAIDADEIIKGGTGYYYPDGGEQLPYEIEHIMPDYSLYGIKDTAYGFLTRGCPRGCNFCIVKDKEGRASRKVADLSEWWNGQKYIELMDPNTLACKDHMDLLQQLADSKAYVNFNQGVDCRLLNDRNIPAINAVKKKDIHFAWDYMKESDRVLKGLKLYASSNPRKIHGGFGTVYCLTNFDTTMEENLYRIYTLRDLGYDPYVMVYEKWKAPIEIKRLQRWCNNKIIFKKCERFEDYKP